MAKYFHTEDFFEGQLPEFQSLLMLIRESILSADPHLRETLKYNTPFYVRKSWVCYIGIIRKKTGVEIGFPRGYMISNEHGLLQTKGRAAMQGITFLNSDDFLKKEDIFLQILQEALVLDDISTQTAAADIISGKAKLNQTD
jgi:hypothetical protein